MGWGTPIEVERRNRIMVAVHAYAYEIMNEAIIPDLEYDTLSRKINQKLKTGHPVMDDFFRTEFSPDTGMWIYKHPEPEKLIRTYFKITGKRGKSISVYKNEHPPVTKEVSNLGFKTHTEMKIYIASLGFAVLEHTLIGREFGQLDFEFDRDFFHVTQKHTGISKSISYKEYFGE